MTQFLQLFSQFYPCDWCASKICWLQKSITYSVLPSRSPQIHVHASGEREQSDGIDAMDVRHA
jgi:hypothetical protein